MVVFCREGAQLLLGCPYLSGFGMENSGPGSNLSPRQRGTVGYPVGGPCSWWK